jgi:hypothetical protein
VQGGLFRTLASRDNAYQVASGKNAGETALRIRDQHGTDPAFVHLSARLTHRGGGWHGDGMLVANDLIHSAIGHGACLLPEDHDDGAMTEAH